MKDSTNYWAAVVRANPKLLTDSDATVKLSVRELERLICNAFAAGKEEGSDDRGLFSRIFG